MLSKVLLGIFLFVTFYFLDFAILRLVFNVGPEFAKTGAFITAILYSRTTILHIEEEEADDERSD